MKYEYGIGSNKYELDAKDDLEAYAIKVLDKIFGGNGELEKFLEGNIYNIKSVGKNIKKIN